MKLSWCSHTTVTFPVSLTLLFLNMMPNLLNNLSVLLD